MKYASGYHRLKTKYEALQIVHDADKRLLNATIKEIENAVAEINELNNFLNFKSEVVNTLIEANHEKACKIDDLQIAKSHLSIINDALTDSLQNREELIATYGKAIETRKQLTEAQSKLIKVLAFGWVVFIVAFLIFLFTF